MGLMNVLAVAASSEGAFNVATVMTEAINSVKGDVFSVLTVAVPAVALVVGATVAVKFGIKWLRQLGKG